MDLIKQAFSLEASKKQLAIEVYKTAVRGLVNKDYSMSVDDAHTELSSIFGQLWFAKQTTMGNYELNAQFYADTNVAFNYANFMLGTDDRFIKLSKDVLSEEHRVEDAKLKIYAKHMNCVLTATTAKAVNQVLFGA